MLDTPWKVIATLLASESYKRLILKIKQTHPEILHDRHQSLIARQTSTTLDTILCERVFSVPNSL